MLTFDGHDSSTLVMRTQWLTNCTRMEVLLLTVILVEQTTLSMAQSACSSGPGKLSWHHTGLVDRKGMP